MCLHQKIRLRKHLMCKHQKKGMRSLFVFASENRDVEHFLCLHQKFGVGSTLIMRLHQYIWV